MRIRHLQRLSLLALVGGSLGCALRHHGAPSPGQAAAMREEVLVRSVDGPGAAEEARRQLARLDGLRAELEVEREALRRDLIVLHDDPATPPEAFLERYASFERKRDAVMRDVLDATEALRGAVRPEAWPDVLAAP